MLQKQLRWTFMHQLKGYGWKFTVTDGNSQNFPLKSNRLGTSYGTIRACVNISSPLEVTNETRSENRKRGVQVYTVHRKRCEQRPSTKRHCKCQLLRTRTHARTQLAPRAVLVLLTLQSDDPMDVLSDSKRNLSTRTALFVFIYFPAPFSLDWRTNLLRLHISKITDSSLSAWINVHFTSTNNPPYCFIFQPPRVQFLAKNMLSWVLPSSRLLRGGGLKPMFRDHLWIPSLRLTIWRCSKMCLNI